MRCNKREGDSKRVIARKRYSHRNKGEIDNNKEIEREREKEKSVKSISG